MKIEANEELFNKWQLIGRYVIELGAIFQNDSELSEKYIRTWWLNIDDLHTDINFLKEDSLNYLDLCRSKK